jgi:hypothetical protein
MPALAVAYCIYESSCLVFHHPASLSHVPQTKQSERETVPRASGGTRLLPCPLCEREKRFHVCVKQAPGFRTCGRTRISGGPWRTSVSITNSLGVYINRRACFLVRQQTRVKHINLDSATPWITAKPPSRPSTPHSRTLKDLNRQASKVEPTLMHTEASLPQRPTHKVLKA